MEEKYGLHIGDYIIFAGMISFSIGIGIYYAFSGGKQKTILEYLVGNREMKMLPVALSLVVTFDSSVLILGYPAEVYIYGVMLFWNCVSVFITMLLAARIVVPLLHPLKLKSLFEYFDLRYKSRAPRILGTVIGMLYNLFSTGTVLYGPAIALEAVADFPFWASVLSVAVTAMIYTSIGGIKAVVWTDVMQCAIMMLGMFAVIIKGTLDVGGISKVWHINYENLRLNFFDFNPDPLIRHTFWPLTIGSILYYFNTAFNQATLQRISSVKTMREAKKIVMVSGPLFMVIGQLAVFEGLIIFAYFNVIGCDPIKAGYIVNANQILPYMVVRIFKDVPGLAGLFLASLFSASLSTISSCLNSLSAQTVEDFVKPMFPNMTERKKTCIAKISVIIYGLLSLGITVMIANIPGSLVEVSASLLTSFAGPLAGLFLFSVFCPWATPKGFLIGGFLSMSFVFWMSLGRNFFLSRPSQPWLPLNPVNTCPLNATFMSNATVVNSNGIATRIAAYEEDMFIYLENEPEGVDRLYSVSYRWFGAIGISLSIVLGSIISFITGYPRPEEVDAKYILPIGDMLFPYLPKLARKWLEFGVDFKKREKWLQELEGNLPKLIQPDLKHDVCSPVLDDECVEARSANGCDKSENRVV